MFKKVEIVERISKEGNTYKALELTFANGYKKLVLLKSAEVFMIEEILNNAK